MKKTYDRDWQRLALRQLRRYPTCQRIGCGNQAKHVDHKVPISAAPWRRLDPTNLQSLCTACHNRITRAYDLGSIKGACTVDGDPLDPHHPWAQHDNAQAIATVNTTRRADPILAARLKSDAITGRQSRPRRGPGGIS